MHLFNLDVSMLDLPEEKHRLYSERINCSCNKRIGSSGTEPLTSVPSVSSKLQERSSTIMKIELNLFYEMSLHWHV